MSTYDRDYYRPGGFSFFPPVIKNLLIINGAVFFIMLIMKNINFDGTPAENIILRWFALMPISSGYFEIWQLITYQFLHGGFAHILFNMFALWMFGAEIENIMGSKKFLLFYLICGVGAGLLHLFLSPLFSSIPAPTIGASGAIYGVMIAFALMFPNRLIFLYFFIPIKAKYFIAAMVLLEFLAVPSATSNVAHLAHLGGALVGFIFILADKNLDISLKYTFRSLSNKRKSYSNRRIYKNEPDIEDAKFYDVKNKEEDEITQEDIDKILDKISQSGYKNLTEKEKKILFEASKRMK
ncbi:MAG: rhomboid family intramembrane serine protease [Ignavibacterium sp.]